MMHNLRAEILAKYLRDIPGGTHLGGEELRSIQARLLDLSADVTTVEHENGFFKATLWQSDDNQESLRVHVWPGGENAGWNSNIHSHGWDFTSLILCGHLVQEHYLAGRGQARPRYRYRPGSHVAPEADGEGRIGLVDRKEFDAGDVYSFPLDALHRIASTASGGSASLVLTRRRGSSADVEVYRDAYHVDSPRRRMNLRAALAAAFAA